MSAIRLGGPQEIRLLDALTASFDGEDMDELVTAAEHSFDQFKIHGARPRAHVRALVRGATTQGWLLTLIEKACEAAPDEPAFRQIYTELTDPAAAAAEQEAVANHLVLALVSGASDGAAAVRDVCDALAGLPVTVRDRTAAGRFTGADGVVFVLTAGVVDDNACRAEIDQIRARELPVTVVRADLGLPVPSRLAEAPIIDLRTDAAAGWPTLRERIAYLASPDYQLTALLDRRRSLRRRADQAGPAARRWFDAELAALDRRIREAQGRRDDPAAARSRADDEVSDGIREEYEPDAAPDDRAGVVIAGRPPEIPPNEFRDRVQQLGDLERDVTDANVRLVALTGVAGIGKTGVLSRLLDRVGTPDSPVIARRFVYLPALGHRPVNASTLVWELARTVVEPEAIRPLLEVLRRSQPMVDKLDAVLRTLQRTEVVVLVDNAEELIDDRGELQDRELGRIVDRLLSADDHRVRLVLATRRTPDGLLGRAGDRGRRVRIGEGLPSKDARDFLNRLDGEGLGVLADADRHDQEWLAELTGGSPRLLELAFDVLRGSPGQTLAWLVRMMAPIDPAALPGQLIEWIFKELDPVDRRVVQALAIYRWPVRHSAVGYLLRDLVPGQNVGARLNDLCRRRLARRDGPFYFLPRDPDGAYVLKTIDQGDASETPRLTREFLYRRAADYFAALRPPTATVREAGQLRPDFMEIDLRICAGQFERAEDLIAAIEDAHLLRWGQNGTLIPMLERLPEFADFEREFQRRALLIRAYKHVGEFRSALGCAREATVLARRSHRKAAVCRALSHAGAAHFELGEIGRAITCYRDALRTVSVTQRWHLPYERLVAHEGLALSLGRAGQLSSALRHCAAGRRLLPRIPDDEDPRIETFLTQAAAWVEAQRGHPDRARKLLRTGYEVARGREIWLLAGQCLNSESQVLVDAGDLAGAVETASQAADLGLRCNSGALYRSANESLALASLIGRRLPEAAAAAALAVRQEPGLYGLVLSGLVAVHQDDRDAARRAFSLARDLAEQRRKADDADVETRDLHAVALFGFAGHDPSVSVEDACRAFQDARRATSAPGAVGRVQRLLRQFEGHADAASLARARRAADPT
nr:AAA family ATPase [uncultured Actinoplanes sp.]